MTPHLGLAISRANYWADRNQWADREEIVSEAFHALTIAGNSHDPERGLFSSWAYLVIDQRISAMLKRERRHEHSGLPDMAHTHSDFARIDNRDEIESCGEVGLELELWSQGYTHSEVGEIIGITTSGAGKKVRRSIKRLRSGS